MKRLLWIGSSKQDVLSFPVGARRNAGYQLDKVQRGEEPDDWKPMPSVGPGVREIRIHVEGAFRVLYVANIGDAIHVLHAFQKKTQKTPLRDVRLARQRLSLLEGERT